MDSIKSMFFTFIFMTFLLVAMTQLPQLRGMPLDAQLSHIAHSTIQYISELASPLMNIFYRYFY